MARKSLRIIADDTEGAFDDFFRQRAGDRFRFAFRCVEAAAEVRLGGRVWVFSGALREVAIERTVQFGSDRYATRVAAFAFEEAGWESDVAADLAVVHHVADGER